MNFEIWQWPDREQMDELFLKNVAIASINKINLALLI